VAEYADWGGHRFHGWTDYSDASNYLGPTIWSEADCVFRFCLELEKSFPRNVHCEFSIDKSTRQDWELRGQRAVAGKRPGREIIDIVVSDLDRFVADETARDMFRRKRHEAFIEVKWLKKGWRGHAFEHDARKRVTGVEHDLQRLAWNLEIGRCLTAAMLVVDDEGFLDEHAASIPWPPDVERFVLGPAELERRGLLATGA
jgi:hypothetical protein